MAIQNALQYTSWKLSIRLGLIPNMPRYAEVLSATDALPDERTAELQGEVVVERCMFAAYARHTSLSIMLEIVSHAYYA